MLAPRQEATDDENTDSGSQTASSSSESEKNETTLEKPVNVLGSHAVDIGESPLGSEDERSLTEAIQRSPSSPPKESIPEENPFPSEHELEESKKGPQPYDVPVAGDFFMHDDRFSSPVNPNSILSKFFDCR